MTADARIRLRCPKCRSRNFAFTEIIEATTTWDVVNGLFARRAGINEPEGITGYSARCARCDHFWRVRGSYISLVDELQTDLRRREALASPRSLTGDDGHG